MTKQCKEFCVNFIFMHKTHVLLSKSNSSYAFEEFGNRISCANMESEFLKKKKIIIYEKTADKSTYWYNISPIYYPNLDRKSEKRN